MRALTSSTLNLIICDVHVKKLKSFSMVNVDIEIQTTKDQNNILIGLRFKWRFLGVDKTEKINSFHLLAEDTYSVLKPEEIKIEETEVLVDKSYSKVRKELKAQIIKKANGNISVPENPDPSIAQRVYSRIQKSL